MKNSNQKISVIIFEDNAHLRETLKILLTSSEQFECAGAFTDTRNVVDVTENLVPEVIIMDIEMPGMNGIDATRLVKQRFPNMPVLILTMFDDSEKIFQALQAGGSGYLLKNSSPEEILQALVEVYNGGTALSPAVAKKVVQFFQTTVPTQQTDYDLTAEEKEILQHLVKGRSYKMIADVMEITLETVKSYVKNVYRKLHVTSNNEAVIKAVKHKIV